MAQKLFFINYFLKDRVPEIGHFWYSENSFACKMYFKPQQAKKYMEQIKKLIKTLGNFVERFFIQLRETHRDNLYLLQMVLSQYQLIST